MGLLTSLALALIPLRRESTRLEAEIEKLEREVSELRDRAERWETLANSWRVRYEATDTRSLQQARATMQAPLDAYQNQMMQNAYYDGFCNCVPARRDMLLGSQ